MNIVESSGDSFIVFGPDGASFGIEIRLVGRAVLFPLAILPLDVVGPDRPQAKQREGDARHRDERTEDPPPAARQGRSETSHPAVTLSATGRDEASRIREDCQK
jgi:hypothetical protein